MISKIGQNSKVTFKGTTIIQKPNVQLTKKMLEAVNDSILGYYGKDVNGYTVVIVSTEAYAEEEAKFIKELKIHDPLIKMVNFTRTLDWRGKFSYEESIPKFIDKIRELRLF